jgi:hypothetical protein
MTTDVIVTVQHLHTVPSWSDRPGYCSRMSRAFAAQHGLDWQDFVRDGVPASVLEATGDVLACRLAAWAREQEAR